MFTQDIADTLAKTGLKKEEIRIYVTCLESHRGLQVHELTTITGIKRSTVNLILDRLLLAKRISFHLEGKRRIFTAEPIEHLLYDLESTVTDLRGIIPLLAANSPKNSASKVRFFEGREGVRKVFADQLLTLRLNRNPKRELLVMSSGKDLLTVIPDHQKSFIDKRVKERIPVRWIAPDTPESQRFLNDSEKNLREMRFFDASTYPFIMELTVYAHKISLLNLDIKSSSGFIIENINLAKSMRSLFNLLWNSLPKAK